MSTKDVTTGIKLWKWTLALLVTLMFGASLSCGGGGGSNQQLSNLDEATVSAASAIEFLARIMDQYHERLPVHDDVSSAGNHFVTFGKIPNENAPVLVNGSWADNPHTGATAIRFEFTGPDFGGFYFLNGVLKAGATSPVTNFGETANAGLNLNGATTLTFWARGEQGGETIDFFVAGVGRDATSGVAATPFPGSSPRIPAFGNRFTLTTQWQEFTINLQGADLSYVLGGFGWQANDVDNPNGAVFIVDDIQFNLSDVARNIRLNEPRFLTSFVTLPRQPDPFDADPDDDIDLVLRNLAFSYDNALALLAFLAEGSSDSLRRARLLGDAFVYAAENDRFFNDGRIRTAYAAGDIALPPGWTPNGRIGTVPISGFFSEDQQQFFEVEQESVDVGNNAWSMIALLALFRETGDQRYLASAQKIGEFIQMFKNENGTFQGFQGGIDDPEGASPSLREFASAEHNIDVFAAFKVMANLTSELAWNQDAEHARQFVEAMWDTQRACYLAGTSNPETRNEALGQLPSDVQTWSILAGIPDALQNALSVLGCVESNHRTIADGFSGIDFNEDQDGVWFEGTAHTAAAFTSINQIELAEELKETLRNAQQAAPFGDGGGITASSRDGLSTGFGFEFFSRLHVAATSWLVFAQLDANPYYLQSVPQ